MRAISVSTIVWAMASLVAIDAHAALVSTDGGLGVYDTTNNVTWTSNASLFATQAASFSGGAPAFVATVVADSGGTATSSDFNASTGTMDWFGAQAWIHYLNVTDYGGSNQWALPTTVDSETSESTHPSQSSSQMAQLFYGGLGQVAGTSIVTSHNANYSLFSNVQNADYWSGTQVSADPVAAWDFAPQTGAQGQSPKTSLEYALAVSPGQVSAVPLPAAAWLLLSGLGGLGIAGRKRLQS